MPKYNSMGLAFSTKPFTINPFDQYLRTTELSVSCFFCCESRVLFAFEYLA